MSPSSEPATARQLRFLRALAERTGTTFTIPRTRAEASREIRRLKGLRALTASERQDERRALDADREHLQLSTSIRSDELSGYGSHARWKTG
ncbi:MAG: hypothetical protein ACRDJX_00580 [Solirubrobacteraceae bacterium]